ERVAAVLILDVSRFRVINESIGHALGDRVLQEVATSLQAQLRPGDSLARPEADRFAVLLADLREGKDAVRVCRRLLG
ncbi:MAG: diguanylate cyclase, partial [Akkermansiaceae bacterium]|nr:diguanylate cyclase [Akkermansiaceae bacterium]